MCLTPLSIRNPTKRISKVGGQLLSMHVPCGQCAECLQTKRNEWYFRTYYQCLDVFSKGGYVHFVTLTYASKHLPHLSDFISLDGVADMSCFNLAHYRDFIKRLRTSLFRAGYGTNCFKYFLVSEYGTDERFTKRPHYHVLFFVYNSNLDFITLSQYIQKCWTYGLTDGIDNKPFDYVRNHTFLSSDATTDLSGVLNCCLYISKYVTKSDDYDNKLNSRLSRLKSMSKYIDFDFELLSRQVKLFHRQSQGFGIHYLDTLSTTDYERLFKDNLSFMPDSSRVYNYISLPLYFARKLFYTLTKTSTGYSWKLNEEGKKWKIHLAQHNIDKLSDIYTSTYLDCTDSQRSIIDNLLDGRNIKDYATYLLFYRGRHLPLTNEPIYHWIDYIITHSNVYDEKEDNLLFHYNPDKPLFAIRDMVTNKNLDTYLNFDLYSFGKLTTSLTQVHPHMRDGKTSEITYIGDAQTYDSYIKQYTFNQYTLFEFRYFDDLYNYFIYIKKDRNLSIQHTFDAKQHYTDIYNSFKPSNHI